MRFRTIIIYWLLVLVPTVLIGFSAFRLLQHEQERIDQQFFSAVEEQARAIADSIQLTVGAVQEELTHALLGIPSERLTETLLSWQSQNPLIRNVFIWSVRRGLLLPPPGLEATDEEKGFMARYRALISGRTSWRTLNQTSDAAVQASDSRGAGAQAETNLNPSKKQRPGAQSLKKMRKGRRSLLDLAKRVPDAGSELARQSALHSESAGWLPWFSENSLFILGWVQPSPQKWVYGVELEVMTLLSRLLADFPSPSTVPEGLVFALLDGNGLILHRSGAGRIETGRPADVAITLAPQLPHWQFAVYFTDEAVVAGKGRSFAILSGLLLATLMVAILSGVGLMTWQAVRNHRDARQKTSFVSNVSHELKTPLTSIRMYAELISSGRVQSEEKKARYLDVIVSESQRLTRLVNNVLDFSRLEQGRKNYRIRPVDLAKYVADFIESHRMPIESAGMKISSRIAPADFTVAADRDVLEQVLLNLVDNAVKYAAGGGALSVELAGGADHVRLSIGDRGPGIAPAQREKIFETYHRIDDTLTAKQPGSGLGLSIARRLLRETGGDLRFEARRGGGSCFVAVLPRDVAVEKGEDGR